MEAVMFIEVTTVLPDGHSILGRYANEQQARCAAVDAVRLYGPHIYLCDKRGAWEVVSANPPRNDYTQNWIQQS